MVQVAELTLNELQGVLWLSEANRKFHTLAGSRHLKIHLRSLYTSALSRLFSADALLVDFMSTFLLVTSVTLQKFS